MILSCSLSAQWRLWINWASAHCRLIWVFSGLTCQFVGFVTNGRVIFGNSAVENFFMSWVQVLDFTKSLLYSNCQHDRFFFFFFFFFFFPFICHVCVLLLICLFIISGEFDAVKKDPLEIQHPKLENSRRGPFMRDNGRCDILHAA